MGFSFFNIFTGDIAIDLGTANTVLYMKGKGIILDEPSIVARSAHDGEVVAVGIDAKDMLGKTHRDIVTIRPLKDGVIADFEMTDAMIRGFIRKINLSRIARPRMVICIPSGITEVEKRAVRDSADRANAREVYLVDEPVAAAIGIGIDISRPVGNIIVDIGGGTTEIAVIALNGIVTKQAIRVAGDEMDEAIVQYFKTEHNLLIGERTAEMIKCSVGSAMPISDTTIQVKGRSLVAGIPKTIEVSSVEIRECLKDTLDLIIQAVKQALENTPPELSSDILDRGIILTGGGALLKGLDQRIRVETDLPVNVAETPLLSVVKGAGMIIDDVEKYRDVLV
ncbi:MAG: rod shape-determining protein [Candidatus Marinimicrobia bacterium]|jgi:rod shape-determining protein MreB|nr:rod shape-determining protein [Candidatus Neomarinimicrobiota bacterium]MCK9484535.1 rod shape-determining protein [Candidatus Neomarinimicrobiota bacterium]MCK9559762.1 rod shape-determining protein [Candidatus Neomarinimicrobiota bacterium]MDD5060939.1 rod shape-determining protein [Candidatus Neomarinimicrobiota bacterium]MDD5230482.1 rod shape-determining protein [Candidatus Neomarinimicrobiota bacterium]